ncbi:UNVERIFIED_CONTAM: hypothetical protein FKN15_000888 [Acipenser sinensis]
MPQRFDALRPFEPRATAPSVACCPRASVPQRFDALGASTPQGFLSSAHCALGGLRPMRSTASVLRHPLHLEDCMPVLRHFKVFIVLHPSTLETLQPLVLHSLCTSVLQHPRCL